MKNLKRWFQDKIGIGENRDRLFYLEKQVKINQLLLQKVLPNAIDYEVEQLDLPFLKHHDLASTLSYKIHKNDLMFLSSLLARNSNLEATLNEYFSVGIETAQLLAQTLAHQKVESFLDFGAGYGRVSRFLPHILPAPLQVFTSDIKPEAVLFNTNQFGFKGVYHTTQPQTFETQQCFDAIFAGSVFTHLPQKLTEAWLQVLAQHLNPNGTLIFTVHNKVNFGISASSDFVFKNHSEDSFFETVKDSLQDSQEYGSAFVSIDLVHQWMKNIGLEATIINKGFGGTQDLVVAKKVK